MSESDIVEKGSVARFEITTINLEDGTEEAADSPPTLDIWDADGTQRITDAVSTLKTGTTAQYYYDAQFQDSWGVGEYRLMWKWTKGGGNFKATDTFMVEETENI